MPLIFFVIVLFEIVTENLLSAIDRPSWFWRSSGMSNSTERPNAPLPLLSVPGTTRFEIGTGAPGTVVTTSMSCLPLLPLTALTVRSSLISDESERLLPGAPAYACVVPVPTTALLQAAGKSALPSICVWVHDG